MWHQEKCQNLEREAERNSLAIEDEADGIRVVVRHEAIVVKEAKTVGRKVDAEAQISQEYETHELKWRKKGHLLQCKSGYNK